MARVERFEELKIWQKAVEIALDIFNISDVGSLKSDFSTKDQIRRSALSISSNIAEGFEYNSHLEFLRFLKYAKGSAGELRSQLFILQKLNLIEAEFYKNKFEELEQLSKQISSFMKYIREFQSKK